MSTEVLTFSPEFELEEGIEYDTTIYTLPGGKEKRYSNTERGIRTLTCRLRFKNPLIINHVWNFFRRRRGQYDPFWVKFPSEHKVTGEVVGVGNGEATEFDLDKFPADISSLAVYVGGVKQESGWAALNNLTDEKTKIIFDSPPEGEISVDYEHYFQVRFVDRKFSRRLMSYKLYNTGLNLIEVLWDDYDDEPE